MNLDSFLQATLAPRQASIDVPELREYFGDDSPVWIVRGLTAAEMGRCNEAADKGPENTKALIEALAGSGDKAEALRKSMGIAEGEVPTDVSRRIDMLTIGSVSPELGSNRRDVAVKLSETYPTVFYNLTNHILSLTGQGAETTGKRRRSGKMAESEQ